MSHHLSPKAVTSSLGGLHISSDRKAPATMKKAEPAESWEDEADGSSDTETEVSTPVRPSTSDMPGAPPPTPASPSFRNRMGGMVYEPHTFAGAFGEDSGSFSSSVGPRNDERRPEKTTAIASRLIAAGIGQKAPKRTDEQRRYDQAMKVQEKKKRDQAKAEEERKKNEKVQAQNDIWAD